MSDAADVKPLPPEPAASSWAAVFSLALGVFGLLTAEYLPTSLLTPMAADLGVSEALAGQAVTVTAVAAMLSGLLTASLTRKVDRRIVLLGFTVLMIVSNLLVAVASSLAVLLVMRILLGIALGGFWSLAAAVAMRLVPSTLVPRAVSIIFSGIAVATIVAVPLGSYLGEWSGWRSAFLAAAALGVVTLVFQSLALPRMAPRVTARLATLWTVLRRPGFALGIVGMVLVHIGHYALFTYIRPALENLAKADVDELALLLFVFGVANFVGTLVAGWLLGHSLRLTLALMPALMGVAALSLALLPVGRAGYVILVVLWGLAFGGVSVAWSNWATRMVPDQAESAGGLVVVGVQSAIAGGAAAGGVMFGIGGVVTVFTISSAVLLASALLIALRVKAPDTARI
ncbi:MFS transporter [Streptomyces rapamycinicus]|uniref:MFS family arabinose efflux permease n=1 Tax=Streptomyces rapamycinicus TaxID=1226757 RepID=A0ABR6M439_9ACTN|nr:MFS transporter [Streptomyces rapamycinicus]MBB4788672.1 putative MFS family arabinose efflux permease [Streptomyces rapamycinicus]UTP35756.1 MFS transporter [Streptomyces rapamycinicus NRRL 5491]